MSDIYICFNLKSISAPVETNSLFEKDYNLVYKPLIKFLYSHEDFPFSFSFTGNQIIFFKKRKNEIISIIRELIERKQVEILGGGYYDPVLPLIYPVDRNGQIDSLSTELRHTVGKRPRGITLHGDIWDSSLINNIHTCGIEYVLLDSSLVPENKQIFIPLIITDLGKTVDIFPYYNNFNPTPDMSPEIFINNIINKVQYVEKKNPIFQLEPERVITLNLNHEEMYNLGESGWFNKLYDYVKSIDNIKITTPYYFKKEFKLKIPAYIPAGLNENLRKFIGTPFKENNTRNKSSCTVFDFMETYKLSNSLYSRMMYVSMLVNQYKNDKMRKKSARDKLWQAQNGNSLIWSNIDIKANLVNRQNAYKHLMESEIILREDRKFKESVTSFDYNNDGLNEYVCRMDQYFAYISLISGSVQELELLKNTGNYTDNLSRLGDFDGCTDNYKRGIFVDHVFNDKQFEQYVNNEAASDGIFSKIIYNEVKYSQGRREIQLDARAVLKNNIPVYLRKKFIINSTGMYVQYILKNESEKKLKIKFAVESNFACLNYTSGNKNYYNMEVISDNEKRLIDDNQKRKNDGNDNVMNDVSFVRITDVENGITFVYEPNEKCGYNFNTIEFKRPDHSKNNINVEKTLVSTLFWDIEIDPSMETEKNINFTIIPLKKNKRN